jgi:Mrp family chromosome partitioning ATPase
VIHAAGLAEVLDGTVALEQALAATPQSHLHVLAATSPHAMDRMIAEENVRWLAARLRERFDLIFVDGPAWEGSDAPAALAIMADAVYLVLEAGEAESPAVRKITRTLAGRGCRLGGLIMAQ